jgi:competence protein ComEC
MRCIRTRFRAYHLGTSGSSFSYFADGRFAMIEGRLTEESRPQVEREMENCGVDEASSLHIQTTVTETNCRSS